MIEKHISTENLARLAYADRADKTLLALAAEVNRHLVTCEHCRRTYEALQEIKEAVRDGITPVVKESRLEDGFALRDGDDRLLTSRDR
ncbi:MAG: hypothetical protein IJ168_03650 [Eubacterium sp.]|nr:hypothetical protein [Eubacterium sp.]